MFRWIAERRFGRVIEVRSQFLHSSDLDPEKPINWKRIAAFNGEYGCMGDLGMHALHLPLRAGWMPRNVRAILSDVVAERPGADGAPVPCDTWDNAVLLCEAEHDGLPFPLRIETKRIAPGETNTWTIEVDGTEGSIAYTTKLPKTLRTMRYEPGGAAGVAGARSRLASRPTRRSRARSSSSASRTRSCRCGPPSSTSSRTDARG